jgi:hypothetical protein
VIFPTVQKEPRVKDQQMAELRHPSPHQILPEADCPNVISENILKCLSSILLRISAVKNLGSAGDISSPLWTSKPQNHIEGTWSWDPYGICLEFGKRDIGPYKYLCAIDAKSFNAKRTTSTLFLLHRLKYVIIYSAEMTVYFRLVAFSLDEKYLTVTVF